VLCAYEMRMAQRGVIVIGIVIGLALFGRSRPPEEVSQPQVRMMLAKDAPEEVRLKKRGNGHSYVHGMVNGQIVEFLVDTGASGIALTVEDARRIGLKVDRSRWRVIGSGASGAVRGQIERLDRVEVEGRVVTNLDAMVANGLEISLLGQDFLAHAGSLTMSGDTMVLR
jgi:aspartyl protease family protein